VLPKDVPAKGLNFTLEPHVEARLFQTKVQTADTREK
jgi:hypothetical protein